MEITPQFKDEQDKMIALATILASMFLFFIPALIVIVCAKEYVSESTYKISKAFFNFELFLFILSLVFIVPLIGFILKIIFLPLLILFNVIVVIYNVFNIAGNKKIKTPRNLEFI